MSLPARLGARFRLELVGRTVAALSSGLLMVMLARLLDPDEYGLLFLAIAVFGAVGIASKLGIAKSGARYVAEYRERDPAQLPHILRTVLAFNLVAIAVVGVGLLLGHRRLAALLEEPGLAPLLLLGVGYLALEALFAYARLMLQGLEEIGYSATVHALGHAARLAFAVGFVALGYGAIGALAGYLLAFALATALGLWLLYRRYYRGGEAAATPESGLRRRIGEYAVPLTATDTANVLDKRVDTILVGFFLTPVAVSSYVLGKQIVEFVETPVAALGFTLSPTFGAQKAGGDVDRAARVYETALTNTLLLYVPVAAGLVLVAEPALELVFGDEYLGAVPVLQVLGCYVVLRSVTELTSNGLDFLGRARARAVVKGATAVLNVALNVVLIPTVGVVGAAVATVLTYGLYTVANVYILHQEFDLRLAVLGRRLSLVVAVTGGMAAVVFVAVDYVEGLLSLLLVVALGVAVWSALSVLAGLLDPRRISAAL